MIQLQLLIATFLLSLCYTFAQNSTNTSNNSTDGTQITVPVENFTSTTAKMTSRVTTRHPKVTTKPASTVEGLHSPLSNPLLKNLSRIPERELQIILEMCENNTNCVNQTESAKYRRSVVKQIRLDSLKRSDSFRLYPVLAEKTVETTLALVFKAKKAHLRRFGFPKDLVEPADDGLFYGNVLMTSEEANQIIRQSFAEVPGLASEKEFRSSISTDQHISSVWTMPIPYFISSNISIANAKIIDEVVAKIQNQTCIRFSKKAKILDAEISSVLTFAKLPSYAGELWCSLSTFGHVHSSIIFLNENCSTLEGEISHSILKVLGLTNSFTRLDRDRYLEIQWTKILPEFFDVFVLDDKFLKTSFGLPFDFSSIMNFPSTFGVKNPSDKSILFKNSTVEAVLGQRLKISCGDFENLKKIYCCPGCLDLNSQCGFLSNSGFCQSKHNWFWMKQNCPKSCEFCCKDSCAPDCMEFCNIRGLSGQICYKGVCISKP